MTFDESILSSSPGSDTGSLAVDELIDEIITVHHLLLREDVLRIDRIVRDMTEHGSTGESTLMEIQQLVQGLAACVESQLTTEERLVFPMLRRLQHQTQITKCRAGMIQSRVMVIEREFARIRGIMLRLQDLAQEYASPNGPCELCHELLRAARDLLSHLVEHSHRELGILYPWAVARERELAATTAAAEDKPS